VLRPQLSDPTLAWSFRRSLRWMLGLATRASPPLRLALLENPLRDGGIELLRSEH
jgi:hypothetical protein